MLLQINRELYKTYILEISLSCKYSLNKFFDRSSDNCLCSCDQGYFPLCLGLVISSDITYLEIQILRSHGVFPEMGRLIYNFVEVRTVSGGRDVLCKSQWQLSGTYYETA